MGRTVLALMLLAGPALAQDGQEERMVCCVRITPPSLRARAYDEYREALKDHARRGGCFADFSKPSPPVSAQNFRLLLEAQERRKHDYCGRRGLEQQPRIPENLLPYWVEPFGPPP